MKNKIKLFSLILCIGSLSGSKITAQITPQFDGVVGTYQRTLVGSGFADVTVALQALIDRI